MGKSFLLRSEAGNVIGYIQQAGNALRCGVRLPERERVCELYVWNADGAVERKELLSLQSEYEWGGQDLEPVGGCVVMDGQILGDTGDDVKVFIQRVLKENSLDNRGEETRLSSSAPNKNQTEGKRSILCRRWPSNPCCLK